MNNQTIARTRNSKNILIFLLLLAPVINHINNEETNIRQKLLQFNDNLETMLQTRIANGDNIVCYVKGVLYV